MREVHFGLPISGVIRIDGDEVTITVNRADTTVFLGPEVRPGGRISLESGKTMFGIILETAQEIVKRKGVNRFTASEVYHEALMTYPELKRNSFMSRIISSTPNHSSFKHYASKRDYFSRIAPGIYTLENKYLPKKTTLEVDSADLESSREEIS
jgi:hypothetical protein